MIKKLVDCIDDPVEINNLFITILNSNKNMTNYCKKVHDKLLLQKEIINLHETQDNQEITNLICKSVIDDIIHNIEIDYVKIPNNHYEKLKDEIDTLKIEVSRLNMINNNQASLIKTLRNNKK